MKEQIMERFVKSVQASIRSENWYGALAIALTLPDICGRMEAPNLNSQKRYTDWFNRYLLGRYTRSIGPDRELHTFLSAEDCYALRCSYLHEGGLVILGQKAQKILHRFHFVVPDKNGNIVHLNQVNNALQLQIDIFCGEVCQSVVLWHQEAMANPEIRPRLENLLVIHDFEGNIRL